jgi:hypothetical protein
MPTLSTLVAITLVCAAALALGKTTLTTVHVVVLGAIPMTVGAWILTSEGRASSTGAASLTFGVFALIAGYLAARQFLPSSVPNRLHLGPEQGKPYVASIVFIVTVFIMLHFALGGIPILSSHIEVDRFAFTNSGLFGIPGRMYLYGAPLAAGLALARSRTIGVPWHADTLSLVAVSVFIISRILSGFKGGLVEVLIVLLVIAVLTQSPVTSVAQIIRQYSFLIVGAIIAVILVATLYSSYHSSTRSLTSTLIARVTTTPAEPATLTLEHKLRQTNVSSLDLDATYFAHEYAGIGTGNPYSFSRLVSTSMLRVDPESSIYASPVTYGGFAEMAFDFGSLIAIIVMMTLGATLAFLETQARQTSLSGYLVCLAAVMAIYFYVIRGGLIYTVINLGLAVVLLLIIGRSVRLIYGSSDRPRRSFSHPVTRPGGLQGLDQRES